MHGGGIKGKQYEALRRIGSTVGGTGTSKKELGMEMRTTGRKLRALERNW